MKTKIVYVLSSSEEDIYLEQLFLSLYSLRIHNASVLVELVVDKQTDATLKGKRELVLKYIDKKIVLDVPDEYNKAERSRWMKTCLRKYVAGDYLFLDTDTIIADKLDEVDDFKGDIGAVLNCHIPIGHHTAKKKMKKWSKRDGWTFRDDLKYYNSGVMFVKGSDLSYNFYNSWHERWKEGIKKYRHYADQSSLAATNEEYHFPITELEGIWNCQLLKNGLPYLEASKIIHYLDFGVYSKTKPWYFYDEEIYKEIKTTGILTDIIKCNVRHAKCAFPKMVSLMADQDLKISQSYIFMCLKNNKSCFAILDFIALILRGVSKLLKF